MMKQESSADALPTDTQKVRAIDLVVQAIPPVPDAIGEYTAMLAAELSKQVNVRLLTMDYFQPSNIPGVEVIQCLQEKGRGRFEKLYRECVEGPAQATILQYNPFAWGRRGWAPDLIQCYLSAAKTRQDRLWCTNFHEVYMMNPGVRSWVMRQYQRRQFIQLSAKSDLAFFCTGKWADKFGNQHARSLPVGCNLIDATEDRLTTRMRYGISKSSFVCGVFGGSHPSRKISWIESAFHAIQAEFRDRSDVILVHVGGDTVDWKVDSGKVVTTGRLKSTDAANVIACMNLMLNPLSDGISSRRSSSISALRQHCPLATTDGSSTEQIWRDMHAGVLLSSVSDEIKWRKDCVSFANQIFENERMHRSAARDIYETHFTWPKIAERLLAELVTGFRRKRIDRRPNT